MTKKTKTSARKLSIRTETVRALDHVDLTRVAGQLAAEPSDGYVCETLSRGLSCWGPCATWIPTCQRC